MSIRKLNDNFNVISNKIQELRYEQQLSQNDLSKRLELLGIDLHKNDIQLIESNQRTVRDYELWGFSQVFNVDLSYFFADIKKYL